MAQLPGRIADARLRYGGYWIERVATQLECALVLEETAGAPASSLVEEALQLIEGAGPGSAGTPGAAPAPVRERELPTEVGQEVESVLAPLSAAARRTTIICVGHAHIDMNWMWGWPETVAITLDTFRTVLDLMSEYPELNFAQSQASCYQIVSEHDPAMLDEIKHRISEKRWEVIAPTWVENDKNMGGSESHVRHLLYTRRYLADLLQIDPDLLTLDFEPDTFGHPRHLPEVLRQGGVRHYVHIRGYDGDYLYRWHAPSGAELLVYMDPYSCIMPIEPTMGPYAPRFCARYGMPAFLRIFGVGDHGGGPTRRDLERFRDMQSWPVFPTLRFGSYAEFFQMAEERSERLPVVDEELNFVMTGCFTSQYRIKDASRRSERRLYEAEAANAAASVLTGTSADAAELERPWRAVLLNQFHDILPGSGVRETREHAMGRYQEAIAASQARLAQAIRRLGSSADTAAAARAAGYAGPDPRTDELFSEGAGVGFGVAAGGLQQVERGRGLFRVFTVFNSLPVAGRSAVEVDLWDWNGDPDRLEATDHEGTVLPTQIIEGKQDGGVSWWGGHKYRRVLVGAELPALGYQTVILRHRDISRVPTPEPYTYRRESWPEFVLENDLLRARLDRDSFALVSLIDKRSGEELIDPDGAGGHFRHIIEDDGFGMTAWIVGRHATVTPLLAGSRNGRYIADGNVLVNLDHNHSPGALRQWVRYSLSFGDSSMTVQVSLDAGSATLTYDVECDWHEIGKNGAGIPQLAFHLPLRYPCNGYRYDAAFGVVDRPELPDQDTVGLRYAAALRNPAGPTTDGPTGGPVAALLTESTFGYRNRSGALGLTLLRSPYDPDPYPELGTHRLRFGVCVARTAEPGELAAHADAFTHPPLSQSTTIHTGELPPRQSVVELASDGPGAAVICALKTAEDGSPDLIVRLFETAGSPVTAVLTFAKPVSTAGATDLFENAHATADKTESPVVHGRTVRVPIAPHRIRTVRVSL